jgi:hypothetical protein
LYLLDTQSQATVSTTQLFQQSYYLAIGWGLAEAFWGITRGWFGGVRLWSDLFEKRDARRVERAQIDPSASIARDYAATSHVESEALVGDDQSSNLSLDDEEGNLLAKIDALQRLRGRRGRGR